MPKFTKYILAIISLSFLNGCMLGPDYKRSTAVVDSQSDFVNEQNSSEQQQEYSPNKWWEGFADDVTTELVEIAIENNQDIKIAAARYLQAQGMYELTTGAQLPQLNYSFDRTRAKSTQDSFGSASTGYRHGLSASYVVDIFGKLKRSQMAAWDEVLSADYATVAVMQGVIAEVVATRTDIAYINKQLQITLSNTKSWENTCKTIERRYSKGLVSSLDVRLARENLAASRAQEKSYEQLLNEAYYKLDVLLGRKAATGATLADFGAELPRLGDIPTGVPAKLLDRRADLKVLELNLSAATNRVGVNIANLYPDLTLTGTYGYSAGSFDKLTRPGFDVYSLVAGVTQPIFTGGQLKAQVEISKASVKEKAANYASGILDAIREVEVALMRERVLREKLAALDERFTEAVASEKLARDRYLKGLEKLVTVLETERRKRISELEISKTISSLWRTRVDLYLALGGDWNVEAENEKIED